MRSSKVVTVVHPDSKVRIALRSTLEAHGCTVATDHSCADLLSDTSVRPDLILLDRSLSDDGFDVLSRLSQKWEEAEIVFLPEGMTREATKSAAIPQLLGIVDRFLRMRTTRDLLAT
jgi:DNA-binding response OmpR family regulator